MQNDLVMSKMRPALYETLRDELRKGLSIDKNKQAIKDEDKEKIDSIYNAIKNVENIYKIMDYLSDTLDLLKLAIQNNESEKIISLSECLISSVIITGRSIANCFLSFGRFFENSGKSFWECWSQWASSLFLNNAEYKCFFLIDERYAEIVTYASLTVKESPQIPRNRWRWKFHPKEKDGSKSDKCVPAEALRFYQR